MNEINQEVKQLRDWCQQYAKELNDMYLSRIEQGWKTVEIILSLNKLIEDAKKWKEMSAEDRKKFEDEHKKIAMQFKVKV